MKFIPKTTDFALSPYTGLTRASWIEAGIYLLEGVFKHIESLNSPIVVPRQDTKITYPHLSAPEEIQITQRKAEMFEGLTRTFFIAAPLIHDNPDLIICGHDLKSYYKNQILRFCTKTDPIYVGDYETLQEITSYANPFKTYQQTVETCALVICLWMTKDEIWETYTQEEKDIIAYVMISQTITKESLEDFTEEEIFPIASIEYTDETSCGCFGPVKIILKSGVERVIDLQKWKAG